MFSKHSQNGVFIYLPTRVLGLWEVKKDAESLSTVMGDCSV